MTMRDISISEHSSTVNCAENFETAERNMMLRGWGRRLLRRTEREEELKVRERREGDWYDTFLVSMRWLYPQYVTEVAKLKNGSVQFLCNVFIMRQGSFREYSEFCFRVLVGVDRQVDSSKLDTYEKRFLGYLGEFCLTLYIFRMQREQRRILELNGSYILATKPLCLARLRLSYDRFMSHITSGERHCRYIHRCIRVCGIVAAKYALKKGRKV